MPGVISAGSEENLDGEEGYEPNRETRCRLCQLAPPPFERAVAFGSYDGALRDLVHLLKFEGLRPAAKVLGRALALSIAAIESELPEHVLVVPVPLHRRRRSERGFNQAEMIARAALKLIAQPARFEMCDALVRLRDTGSQIGLSRNQRRENLRGAFAVNHAVNAAVKPATDSSDNAAAVFGRDILLVDDVYTTGATASECARVLQRAGANRIWVATAGRTLRLYGLPLRIEDSGEEVAEVEDLEVPGSERGAPEGAVQS